MLNFALVGCGRIAKRHSELLGLGQIKGAKLAAACDLIEDKARKIGEQFSVPYFTDMHQMMQNEKVDVVVVLTESGNHAKNVVARWADYPCPRPRTAHSLVPTAGLSYRYSRRAGPTEQPHSLDANLLRSECRAGAPATPSLCCACES